MANIDAVIIAEQPKLAPYIMQMRQNIAQAVGVAVDCIGIKATTTEGLGFCGTGQGMAAKAVALLTTTKA